MKLYKLGLHWSASRFLYNSAVLDTDPPYAPFQSNNKVKSKSFGAANGNGPVRNIKVYRQYLPRGHKRPIWPVLDWSTCSCLRDRCGSACCSSCRQPLRPRLRWRPLDSSTPDCQNDGDLSTNKAKSLSEQKKEKAKDQSLNRSIDCNRHSHGQTANNYIHIVCAQPQITAKQRQHTIVARVQRCE